MFPMEEFSRKQEKYSQVFPTVVEITFMQSLCTALSDLTGMSLAGGPDRLLKSLVGT